MPEKKSAYARELDRVLQEVRDRADVATENQRIDAILKRTGCATLQEYEAHLRQLAKTCGHRSLKRQQEFVDGIINAALTNPDARIKP